MHVLTRVPVLQSRESLRNAHFLNGKLDLAQAEAVADLIASNTEASRKAALNTIRGGFSLY